MVGALIRTPSAGSSCGSSTGEGGDPCRGPGEVGWRDESGCCGKTRGEGSTGARINADPMELTRDREGGVGRGEVCTRPLRLPRITFVTLAPGSCAKTGLEAVGLEPTTESSVVITGAERAIARLGSRRELREAPTASVVRCLELSRMRSERHASRDPSRGAFLRFLPRWGFNFQPSAMIQAFQKSAALLVWGGSPMWPCSLGRARP